MIRFEEQVEEVARHRALSNAEARRPVIEPVFKPAEGFAAPGPERPRNNEKVSDFLGTATIVAMLRDALNIAPEQFKDSHKLALEQITGRLGLIVNGGANAAIHWREIALWARLMAEQLE